MIEKIVKGGGLLKPGKGEGGLKADTSFEDSVRGSWGRHQREGRMRKDD